MFWGRDDVYAKRGSKGGYFPQCNNRWNDRLCPKQKKIKMACEACEHKEWAKLTLDKIVAHLVGYKEDGSDVLGIYPLLPDGTCRFLVFDFDNHEKGAQETDFANTDNEWQDEVNALRRMCEINGIKPLVERSRSGRGAHVWIFFKKPIPASVARNFGFMLLDKGSASVNMKSFHYYDRMYPSQDVASSIGIGVLHGGKNSLTGIVDVAMVGSVYSKGKFNELLNTYGMVIMDECHHAASNTAVEVLQKVNARYVYGVSATIKRDDNLEKIIYMLLGPVRHKFTAKERAMEQGILHLVYPRYTRIVDILESKKDVNKAFDIICKSSLRNEQIEADIQECISNGRTPVILTRYKEQAKILYENLQNTADYVFLLYGNNTDKVNKEIREKIKLVPRDKSMILIATGQKIGEGFDCPRLDTLMLAAPVSFPGRLEQYVGRLNRDYPEKKDVIVYDYIDSHMYYFNKMYTKRLRTYKKMGFDIISGNQKEKQTVNAIYSADNYTDIFERDLAEANNSIIISSPTIIAEKIERFIQILKPRQEAGVKVSVILTNPENGYYGNADFYLNLIEKMKEIGIQVIMLDEDTECFAIIDQELVWHGGMNLLGKVDAWDNLIRIKSESVAQELMGMIQENFVTMT